MCGLTAVINAKSNDKDLSLFMEDAAICGTLRGGDSTGVFQVRTSLDSKYWVHKDAVPGPVFMETAAARGIIRDTHNCVLTVMHHRAATHGTVNRANAHPFIYRTTKNEDKVLMMSHNGTLTKWNRKEDGVTFEVDSEWAAYKMAQLGVAEAVKDFEGAFAFITYDQNEPNLVRLVSNGERPLHFAFVGGNNAVLVASEPQMLWWLATRNRLKIVDNKLFSVGEGKIVTFDVKSLENYEVTTFVKKAPAKSWQPAVQQIGGYNGWHGVRTPVESIAAQVSKLVSGIIRSLKGEPSEEEAGPINNNVVMTANATVSSGKPKISQKAVASTVSDQEVKFLESSLSIPAGTEGLFVPISFDLKTKTLHGEVELVGAGTIATDKYSAQVRQIGTIRKGWKNTTYLVRAAGAMLIERTKSEGLETIIVGEGLEELVLN